MRLILWRELKAMRRAIRDTQKEARRQAILDVAWELFQQQRYETINILDIAHGAGLAKGTIYLYFKTKEEIFFAIQQQQFEHWFDDVDAALRELDQRGMPETIAGCIVESLMRRPALTRLFAIVHAVLERNVEPDAIMRFKQMLQQRIGQTGALVEHSLGTLPPGQGPLFLLRVYAVIVGLQQLAEPAPIAQDVLAQAADLTIFTIDFQRELHATLVVLLQGMSRAATA